MAQEQLGLCIGREVAAADLSGSQYLAVKFTATGVLLAGDAEHPDGWLQNKPILGQEANVCVAGITKAIAAEALAKGANVALDAAGKLVTPATSDAIVGKLLEASSADGDVVSLFIKYAGVSA